MPINALTERFQCHSCQKTQEFKFDFWKKSILNSAVTEGFKLNEGEGQPSTIMTGEFTFHLTYGKQHPRCSKCKTPLDENKLEDFAKSGIAVCEKCNNEISVRSIPDSLKELFPGLKYLVCEDSDLFPTSKSNMTIPQAIKPILFTCPSCAGNLEIDGKDRVVTCKFCNSEIYLPDDLWLRMHPVKTIERWYMVYPDSPSSPDSNNEIGVTQIVTQKLQDWYDIPDVTIDKEGNVYVASSNSSDFGGDVFIVWSFSSELKTRWVRTGLKYSNEDTGISMTDDGNLYLWDKSKFSLQELSSRDGGTLNIIKGQPATKEDPYSFNMKGCGSLLCDTDGTILALINNEIVRYNSIGKRVSLWRDKGEEAKPGGILSTLLNKLSGGSGFNVVPEEDPEWAPFLHELRSHPSRCDSDLIKINLGWDGYVYFSDSSSGGYVAKYDRSGKQHWKVKLNMSAESKACTDSKGNVFILGMKDDKDRNTNLLRISPDGKQIKAVILDLLEGGELEEEKELAVAPDGTIYAFNYYNRLKVFSPDFRRIYISEQSEKDDSEALRRKSEKVANDEEI